MTPMLSLAQFQEKAKMEVLLKNVKSMITKLDSNYFVGNSRLEMNTYADKFIEGLNINNGFEIKFVNMPADYVCSFECDQFENSSKFVMNYNLNTSSDIYNEFALFHEFIHIHQARICELLGKEICPSDQATKLQNEKEAWYAEYYAMVSNFKYLENCHYSNAKYRYKDGTEVSVTVPRFQELIKFNDDPDYFLSELYATIYSAQK